MRRKWILGRSALCALLLTPLGCGDDDGAPTGPRSGTGEPAALELSADSTVLAALGDSVQLTAVVRDPGGEPVAGIDVLWSNLDPSVATVSEDGWVVARGNGTAGVVAHAGELADTAIVVVEQVAASVEVSPAELTLAQGDTARLTVAVADSNGVALDCAALDCAAPAWSSADTAIATVDATGLVTAVRGGGEARVTAAVAGVTGSATLSVLDRLAFASNRDGQYEVYVVNVDGSGETNLTNRSGHDFVPTWSPDGTRVAFQSERSGTQQIHVMDVRDGSVAQLTDSGIVEWFPAWSPDGSRIAFQSYRDGNNEIYVMNPDGSAQTNLTDHSGSDTDPTWSSDGSRIAFISNRDGDDEIYVVNADGSGLTRITSNGALDGDPTWSPDGTRIAFESGENGNFDIYVATVDGSVLTRLTSEPWDEVDPSWSPDGSRIAYGRGGTAGFGIWLVAADGGGEPVRLTDAANRDYPAVWSPDGRLAFIDDRDGDDEIYVIDADGTGRVQVTDNDALDAQPVWRPRP